MKFDSLIILLSGKQKRRGNTSPRTYPWTQAFAMPQLKNKQLSQPTPDIIVFIPLPVLMADCYEGINPT